MIQLSKASLAFGGQTILDGATWGIRDGLRIGLIGPNGAGKTTLLRVLSGTQQLDAGTLDIPGGTTLGYLEQDTQEADTDRSVLEEAMLAFREVLELEKEDARLTHALDAEDDHASAQYLDWLHRLDEVHTRLATFEAHTIKPRTEAVLTGLGFDPDDLHRPLRTFSGGWRMRVALARLLLRKPDFLLLDEPTNHLDIDSIDWLETYLKAYAGTVVIVSHDRYFLDRMVTHTAELSQGQITEYAGNYAFYLSAREERRVQWQAAYDNQQKAIADTERFIERFRSKATKAQQVQSRIKQLDKLERIPPPPVEAATVHFRFPEPRRSGRAVLELSQFSKTYPSAEGPIEVFDDAGPLMMERGDKVALIGKNGAGKSTLARIIRGEEPFEGTRTLGHNVDVAFFAQHQADTLDTRDTILDSLRAVARGQTETELRSLAGAFLFKGDDVFKPIGVLSGGERSRVALARTMLTPANFLILDEPTNHLDMASIAVLVEALKQYSGTFVVVSHDRHFLDQIATKVWRVEAGDVRVFAGNYSDYHWHLEHGTAARQTSGDGAAALVAKASDAPKKSGGPKTKEQKRREAEERAQRSTGPANGTSAAGKKTAPAPAEISSMSAEAVRHAHARTEALILEQETRKSELEKQLADPTLYDDADEMQRVNAAYAGVQQELKTLYAAWEASAEVLSGQG